MRLSEFQQRFQAAILDPNTRVSDAALGMKTRPGAPPQHKLAIHHSHFWTRMTGFVRSGHRHLARYLGVREFGELVKAYIVAHPPGAGSASAVPELLAAFLANEPPWRDSPVLAHLAHYDWHWAIAASGAEEIALEPGQLADLEPTEHVRLNKRAVAAQTWYRFHELDLARLPRSTPPDATPTFLLLHKRSPSDRAREIEHGEYLALDLLARGTTIGDLADRLRALGHDAGAALASWALDELVVVTEPGAAR
jgi:hypothetical protein